MNLSLSINDKMSKLKNYKFGFDFKGSSKKAAVPRKASLTSAIFNLPPQLVIRAKYDYNALFHRELSFVKGDFFYVISDNNDGQPHYEVINPAAKTRGIVPVGYFETVDRYGTQQPNESEEVVAQMPSPEMDIGYEYQAIQSFLDSTDNLVAEEHTLLSPHPSLISYDTKGTANDAYTTLVSMSIMSLEFSVEGDMILIVKAQYTDRNAILIRPLSEFWSLHKYFIKKFPIEAGYKSQPRVIPFLLHRDKLAACPPDEIEKTLNIYLDEVSRLPQALLSSSGMSDFLTVREGDSESNNAEEQDPDDIFMDILSDYSGPTHTKIKVALDGGEMMAWKTPVSTTHSELMESIGRKVGRKVDGVLFKDEAKKMVLVHGDGDLGVLLRTSNQGLTLQIN